MTRPAVSCIKCGAHLNGFIKAGTGGMELMPDDGAFSFCAHCHNLAVFVHSPMGLTLRPATEDEHAEAKALFDY